MSSLEAICEGSNHGGPGAGLVAGLAASTEQTSARQKLLGCLAKKADYLIQLGGDDAVVHRLPNRTVAVGRFAADRRGAGSARVCAGAGSDCLETGCLRMD